MSKPFMELCYCFIVSILNPFSVILILTILIRKLYFLVSMCFASDVSSPEEKEAWINEL